MRTSPWRCFAALPRPHSLRAVSSIRASLTQQAISQPTIRSSPSLYLAYMQTRQFSGTQAQRKDDSKQEAKEVETITQFTQLSEKNLVHENIVKAITSGMRLSEMTEVQSATIKSALEGTDVIAQAKTGTGKTLAFLVPLLQRMIQDDPDLARKSYRPARTTADDIRGIIISPTRELAEQIAEEARRVVRGTSIVVQTAVGGTQKRQCLQQMQRQGCHLLVGTPGRLCDIFDDEYSGVAAPNLKALVLDEADRLLDQGFWPEIQKFSKLIPDRRDQDRQTLMFSATIPKEVVHIVRQTLKPGFQFVRIMGGEQDAPTTERVKQNIVILKGLENQIPALVELAKREVDAHAASPNDTRPFKAIVYFRSTAEVSLARSILGNLSDGGPVTRDAFGLVVRNGKHPLHPAKIVHIHARLTQAQRTMAADRFRTEKSAILLSSDVTARGLDFPNVTHVIQIGSPQDRESYIHRIGRTARAGKEGEGWILVTESEVESVDRMLRRIPIDEDTSLSSAQADMSDPSSEDPKSPTALVRLAANQAPRHEKADVYNVLISSKSQNRGGKRSSVMEVNALTSNGWGMSTPPPYPIDRAQKIGIANIPGLNLVEDRDVPHSHREPSRGSGRSYNDRGENHRPRFSRDRTGVNNKNTRPALDGPSRRPRSDGGDLGSNLFGGESDPPGSGPGEKTWHLGRGQYLPGRRPSRSRRSKFEGEYRHLLAPAPERGSRSSSAYD